jgi:hypothetical protein
MEIFMPGLKRRRCKMTTFNPKFSITNRMTAAIKQIERARGFLEAVRLSDDWVRNMGNQALIKEAHHTTR